MDAAQGAEHPLLQSFDLFEDKEHLREKTYEYIIAMIVACLFPVIRIVMDRTVLEAFGRWCLGMPTHPKKTDEPVSTTDLETLGKFKESAYKCFVQVLLTSLLVYVVSVSDWALDTRRLWSECERLPCRAPVSWGERLVYCVELGFYVQALPMLFLWETKRRDRLETAAHHVATIALIAYSYYLNLTRVGVMVLICHEANDIFLEAAKMTRYARAQRATDATLAVFVVTWFATRVFAFPAVVIRSTLLESAATGRELGVDIQPHYTILNGFLIFLYCLHIYWSYLIVRIAFVRVASGEAKDIREADEHEGVGPPAAESAATPLVHKPSVGKLAHKM